MLKEEILRDKVKKHIREGLRRCAFKAILLDRSRKITPQEREDALEKVIREHIDKILAAIGL